MTNDQIIANIREYCERHADPALVQKYSRYFRDGYNAYGLAKGLAEAKANEILAMPGMNLERVFGIAPELVGSPKYEEPVMAFMMVFKLHKQFSRETFKAIEHWFRIGITNWAHTDYVCGEILSLLFKKKIIVMSDLESWRESENKFQRRAAVVGLIKPMKLSTDFQPYFTFIDPMMMDPEREVHQGLGWFLREIWKRQPEQAEMFLLKWKDQAARLIFQYATEKMTKEEKERFRKTK